MISRSSAWQRALALELVRFAALVAALTLAACTKEACVRGDPGCGSAGANGSGTDDGLGEGGAGHGDSGCPGEALEWEGDPPKAVVEGDLRLLPEASVCAGQVSNPAALLRIDVPEAGDLRFTVQVLDHNLVAELREKCDDPFTREACLDETDDASLTVPNVRAGDTHFLWVTAYSIEDAPTPFRVTAEILP